MHSHQVSLSVCGKLSKHIVSSISANVIIQQQTESDRGIILSLDVDGKPLEFSIGPHADVAYPVALIVALHGLLASPQQFISFINKVRNPTATKTKDFSVLLRLEGNPTTPGYSVNTAAPIINEVVADCESDEERAEVVWAWFVALNEECNAGTPMQRQHHHALASSDENRIITNNNDDDYQVQPNDDHANDNINNYYDINSNNNNSSNNNSNIHNSNSINDNSSSSNNNNNNNNDDDESMRHRSSDVETDASVLALASLTATTTTSTKTSQFTSCSHASDAVLQLPDNSAHPLHTAGLSDGIGNIVNKTPIRHALGGALWALIREKGWASNSAGLLKTLKPTMTVIRKYTTSDPTTHYNQSFLDEAFGVVSETERDQRSVSNTDLNKRTDMQAYLNKEGEFDLGCFVAQVNKKTTQTSGQFATACRVHQRTRSPLNALMACVADLLRACAQTHAEREKSLVNSGDAVTSTSTTTSTSTSTSTSTTTFQTASMDDISDDQVNHANDAGVEQGTQRNGVAESDNVAHVQSIVAECDELRNTGAEYEHNDKYQQQQHESEAKQPTQIESVKEPAHMESAKEPVKLSLMRVAGGTDADAVNAFQNQTPEMLQILFSCLGMTRLDLEGLKRMDMTRLSLLHRKISMNSQFTKDLLSTRLVNAGQRIAGKGTVNPTAIAKVLAHAPVNSGNCGAENGATCGRRASVDMQEVPGGNAGDDDDDTSDANDSITARVVLVDSNDDTSRCVVGSGSYHGDVCDGAGLDNNNNVDVKQVTDSAGVVAINAGVVEGVEGDVEVDTASGSSDSGVNETRSNEEIETKRNTASSGRSIDSVVRVGGDTWSSGGGGDDGHEGDGVHSSALSENRATKRTRLL